MLGAPLRQQPACPGVWEGDGWVPGKAQPPPRSSGETGGGRDLALGHLPDTVGLPGIPVLDTVPSSHCQCAGYKPIPREAAFKGFAQSFRNQWGKKKKGSRSL